MKKVIIAIKSIYAERIYLGTKKIELRKSVPNINPGTLFYIYESTPKKRVTGYFEVDSIEVLPPIDLYLKYKDIIGVTKKEYDQYYLGRKKAVAIKIKRVYKFSGIYELEDLGLKHAPQSYYYF